MAKKEKDLNDLMVEAVEENEECERSYAKGIDKSLIHEDHFQDSFDAFKNIRNKNDEPSLAEQYDPIYDKVWELDDTATLMTGDYQKRFIAEYLQTKIRYERLRIFIAEWKSCDVRGMDIKDALGFKPTTPLGLLQDQAELMDRYLRVLELRAAIDGIELKRIKYRL